MARIHAFSSRARLAVSPTEREITLRVRRWRVRRWLRDREVRWTTLVLAAAVAFMSVCAFGEPSPVDVERRPSIRCSVQHFRCGPEPGGIRDISNPPLLFDRESVLIIAGVWLFVGSLLVLDWLLEADRRHRDEGRVTPERRW